MSIEEYLSSGQKKNILLRMRIQSVNLCLNVTHSVQSQIPDYTLHVTGYFDSE